MISKNTQRQSLRLDRACLRGTTMALMMTALGLGQGYAQELAHRWSFTNSTDSVGGGNVTLLGTASISGGALVLPGGAARVNCATVPIGPTLAANNSITVETWFTTATAADWAKVWMFGTQGASSGASSYIDFTPKTGLGGNPPTMSFKLVNGAETNTRAGAAPAALANGTAILSTVVYDDPHDEIRFYINGVLTDSEVWTGTIAQLGNTVNNYLGAAISYNDPCFTGSIDEFRVWKGAMTTAQALENFNQGPNAIAVHNPHLVTNPTVSINSPGTATAFNLPIQNKGTTTNLTVTAATLSGTDAGLFTVTSTLPLTIAPGATANLAMSFNPGGVPGLYHARVTTASNDGFKPEEIIDITAQAAIPDIDVATAPTYGPVANTAAIQNYNLQVNNVGPGQLEIFDAEFIPGTTAPTHYQQFKLTHDFQQGEQPLTVNGNSNIQLGFSFDGVGLQPGAKVGVLRLYTNDDDEYMLDIPITVNVTGTGGAESAATIAHRWSFNDQSDSVGGAALVLNGDATLTGSSLVLPGGTTRFNYGSIPIGRTIASSSSMTFEGWVTTTTAANWAKVWMFGTAGADEGSTSFVDFTPFSGIDGTPPSMSFRTPALGQITTRADANPAMMTAGTEYHVTTVYDSAAHTISLYIDGVLADTAAWNGEMFQLGNTVQNFLGAPVLYNDGDWIGSIAEFRVWKGAMTATDVANSQTAGKDALPVIGQPVAGDIRIGSVSISGGNIVLGNVTGLVAGQQYHLETGVTLADFASVAGSTFTSTSTIPTVPVNGPRRFVRIVTGAAP